MNYKSTKKNVRRLKRFGDVLIIVTVAGMHAWSSDPVYHGLFSEFK